MMDSTPPFDLFVSRVTYAKEVKPTLGKIRSAECICPAHEDKRPSLIVSEQEDGDVVWHCRAACSKWDVVEALGLKPIDLIPEHKRNARTENNRSPDKGPRFSAWQALRALAVDLITVELAANQIRRDGWLNDEDTAALVAAHDRIRGMIQAGGFRV